ncbi:MAG: CoA transferase [SAR86 cluster bacterium]|jgi:crotonobetainyl-CoA:carnitine CoA-transferase CaiB-like acyl-CoA transferase|nr:CoA transferase [SAR86 cluster bacterium]
MSGPYKGVRVLELTSTVSGPFAGMMLADQGADVIKIEPPGIGDLARFMGTIKDGMGAMFSTLNRNKKCICLDFKNEEDLEVLKKLVSTADVLIENYRPGIVKKLGIDYESLSKINPDLIYCSISGYGQSGPYKEKKVYDPLIQGTVGIPLAQNNQSPELIRTIIYDKVTGLTSAQAISAALYQKAIGEGGQYLPISMMESALYYNWPDLMMNYTFDEGGVNIGELADLFEVYETNDGGVVLIIIANDEVFTKFCTVFDLSLHLDEKYNNLVSRIINKEELTIEINKVTRSLSSKELEDKMDHEGISASICNELNEVYKDPQVVEQGSISEIDHPELGIMRMPKPPANLKGQSSFPRSLAPILGYNNREVLSSINIDDDTIQRMEDREKQNREMLASLMQANEE